MAERPVMGTVESCRKTSSASSVAGSQQEWSDLKLLGRYVGLQFSLEYSPAGVNKWMLVPVPLTVSLVSHLLDNFSTVVWLGRYLLEENI